MEEKKLQDFENKILRKIFGQKETNILWECGYSKIAQVMQTELGGACCTGGKWEKSTQDSSRKTRGTRPLGRPKIMWEDNTICDLKEVDYEGVWKTLAQDRVT